MGKITIVGVGSAEGQLTERAQALLAGGAQILLHTDRCPCADWLRSRKIAFASLDDLYESLEDFDEHARAAAERVRSAAAAGDVVYAVLDVRDRSVGELLGKAELEIVPGPPAEDELLARAAGPTLLLEASDWENYALQASQNVLVREIDSRALAGEVKLKLLECYPEESQVLVRQPNGGIARTELYNLDRLKRYDHRTSAFVPACPELTGLERFGFAELERLTTRLCDPDGCPWDRAQTHETLRKDLIEEAYEVADAIDRRSEADLIEELGDVLFVVALHAEIARRHGSFDMRDVTSGIVEKMLRRHPHVFGGMQGVDAERLGTLWQEIKRQEHGETTHAASMRGVARALPALTRAVKVLKRAGTPDTLKPLAGEGEPLTADALGQALLSLCARAAISGLDAEEALVQATDAYIDALPDE